MPNVCGQLEITKHPSSMRTNWVRELPRYFGLAVAVVELNVTQQGAWHLRMIYCDSDQEEIVGPIFTFLSQRVQT